MKIKVFLVLPSLDDFGVQHDVRTLLRYWNQEEFDVRMLLHSRSGSFADQFPPEMKSFEIDNVVSQAPKLRVIARFNGYRKIIDDFKPDAVISFVPISNYGCVWAKLTIKHRFGLAVSEHAHVSAAMEDKENMDNYFMKLYRMTFPYVYNLKAIDRVKCISEESRQDLVKNHGIQNSKTVLIYNPVPLNEIRKLSTEEVDHPWFLRGEKRKIPVLVNVGRISYQKRQDLLLQAFARVRKDIDARLVIIGSGDQKSLQNLANKLDVGNSVYFTGFQKNPWKWISKSDLFVLSSVWEGLPCVLSESMALSLPIVSTRCPSGPTEMLLNGRAGYLCKVGDIHDLAEKILYALTHPKDTNEKMLVARQNLDRFEPKTVTKKYETLARELASLRGCSNA